MRSTLLAPGERIRIARVIARLNVGGPAIHVCELSSRLPIDRYETRLFTGALAEGEVEMRDVVESRGLKPIRIAGLGRAVRPSDDLRAFAELVKQLRAFRPHIVHTHTAKAGALGRLAARVCGVPRVVHTFHGHVFDGYFTPAVTQAFLMTERMLARLTDRIVAISPRQAAELSGSYRVAMRERFTVIPLGFDFSAFEHLEDERGGIRRELGLGDAPLVTSVGRLTAVKDHELLFRAFALLRTPNVRLLVVGGGELREDLERFAGALGIGERTVFLGFQTNVARILADTNVLALTSKNEGTPVAVIEALAAGCFPVSVDVGGVADVLRDGEFGRLVATRTPEALAAALDDAIASSPDADWRAKAKIYAREKYSLARLVQDHLELYSRLLEGLER